jgi:uncharacterized protein (DUF1800 family)
MCNVLVGCSGGGSGTAVSEGGGVVIGDNGGGGAVVGETGGGSAGPATDPSTNPSTDPSTGPTTGGVNDGGVFAVPAGKPTPADAARFLTQASFGPTSAEIANVQTLGYAAWIDKQLAMPLPAQSHMAFVDARKAALGFQQDIHFNQSWWKQAANEPGQLRQRVAFALSQIFVISTSDPHVDIRGAASFYDMLEADAFKNFRTLLQDVTLHPMMGTYLTYLKNTKEDDKGHLPDENYAREVMQLMTIGLVQLNLDGTPKLDSAGHSIPTYGPGDVAGLAKVFTGLFYYNPNPTPAIFHGAPGVADFLVKPMSFYPDFHSTSAKSFLGVNIPASTKADVGGDIKIALDTLYNHPNVGPFIATRLIQQFVTSNPSKGYVSRVAAVFNNNGSGVRGDLAAVVKAVLMDGEARDPAATVDPGFGKIREPVIRAVNWIRAFGASSRSGNWLLDYVGATVGETPLGSPSVFNYWRPGYVPPITTAMGSRGLKAPEFQIVDEVSAANWVNAIQFWVDQGMGTNTGAGNDVVAGYSAETPLADSPDALIDRMNLLLFYGGMSPTLRGRLLDAVNAVGMPANGNQTQIAAARVNRVKTAIFLSMISPEYLVQR